ncbi:hypothetical protein [Pseudoduganella sp. RAF53_2]|jgi:hypothetical protein|uniref:hypothetical protein n=1 Tax=unclassified Pseudoduganella TaxID=2637179 RepID=UPI003F94903B
MDLDSQIDDLIEVSRIRIYRSSPQQAVIVSDLKAADRLLSGWSKAAIRKAECHVHVKFEDGFELEGNYLFGGRRRQPSLSQYLRDGMRQIATRHGLHAELAGLGALRIPDYVANRKRFDLYSFDPL